MPFDAGAAPNTVFLKRNYNFNLKSIHQLNMKEKAGFKLQDVCGTFILIAEGKENMDFSNIISMNESSKLLWESLQDKEFTVEDMAQILIENYEIADNKPLPHDVALKDAEALAQQWRDSGIIE